MYLTKKNLVLIVTIAASKLVLAQSNDSLQYKTQAYFADKFPITRVFNVEYNQLSPYKFESKLLDDDLPDGKVKNFYQARVSANINLVKKPKWALGTILNYRYTSITTESNALEKRNKKSDFNYHSTAVNFTYFSSLMNKTMLYSASTIVDGSDKHFERVKGILSGTMILKATADTKMTVGLVAIVDPSVQVPVIPTFSYEHRFSNKWTVDFIFPQRLLVKKNILENGRLSLGSELDGTSFYLYNNSQKYELRQMEINSGATYEHYLGKSMIASLKTGIKTIPRTRIFEKNESFDSYLIEAKPSASFYINLGFSFNPF